MPEIITKCDAMNESGIPEHPGWARKQNWIYDVNRFNCRPMRTKEWDFYHFSEGDYNVMATIGHAAFAASFNFGIFNIKTHEKHWVSRIALFKKGKLVFEPAQDEDHDLNVTMKDFKMSFSLHDGIRKIVCEGKDKKEGWGKIEVTVQNDYNNEKMVYLTPFFDDPHHFYLDYKENYYHAKMEVSFGDKKWNFDNATGLIDSGRGYWPYKHEWYWSNASYNDFNGNHTFGWNLGWGFGNTEPGSENIFFYDGKGYKLNKIISNIEPHQQFMPCTMEDDNHQFHLDMEPIYDNCSKTDVLYIHNVCHEVYFNCKGWVMINGERITFENRIAPFEHAYNQW